MNADSTSTANSGVQFRCCACNGEYPTQADCCPACGKRAFYNAQTAAVESTSRDGITIGLVDAMLSLARALNERMAATAAPDPPCETGYCFYAAADSECPAGYCYRYLAQKEEVEARAQMRETV